MTTSAPIAKLNLLDLPNEILLHIGKSDKLLIILCAVCKRLNDLLSPSSKEVVLNIMDENPESSYDYIALYHHTQAYMALKNYNFKQDQLTEADKMALTCFILTTANIKKAIPSKLSDQLLRKLEYPNSTSDPRVPKRVLDEIVKAITPEHLEPNIKVKIVFSLKVTLAACTYSLKIGDKTIIQQVLKEGSEDNKCYKNLSGANLIHSDLSGLDLSYSNMEYTILQNVNFSKTKLHFAILIGSIFKKKLNATKPTFYSDKLGEDNKKITLETVFTESSFFDFKNEKQATLLCKQLDILYQAFMYNNQEKCFNSAITSDLSAKLRNATINNNKKQNLLKSVHDHKIFSHYNSAAQKLNTVFHYHTEAQNKLSEVARNLGMSLRNALN